MKGFGDAMRISERIFNTVEDWQAAWKDRLRGWMAGWLAFGLELILDTIGKGMGKRLDTLIDAFATEYNIPPDVIVKIKEAWKGEGEWTAMLGYSAGGTAVGGIISSTVGPWLKLLEYVGLNLAKSFRLDPYSIITAWRRDPAKYEKFFDDLREQGWSDDRLEALKFFTLYYPTPSELVHWQAREVFEPSMIAKYGLDAEVEEIDPKLFEKAGVSLEQMINHWRAHWVHPDWSQVADMYHRGLITFEDIDRWYRVVEIPPYWRDKLTGITWDLPNRIETRMMARYGLVDKAWLVKHLERIGLHEDYRSIAADFMLAMGIRMDVSARFSKGWLTADQVKSEIEATGLSEEIGDRLYKWIVKNAGPERVEDTRKLTRSLIIKGVKKEEITREEGIEMLMDHQNYAREEAEYVMDVEVAVEGSPETYLEYKMLVEEYKRSQGLPYKIPPPELLAAEKVLKGAEASLKEAQDKGLKEAKLEPYLKAKSDAEYRFRQLLLKWREEK